MKIKIPLFFLLISSFAFAQQTSLSPELLNFPISPEVAKLGNFGNVPVNLFFGQLNQSINLFNGNVGDYAVPINLNYNYSGNKLEETPSIIGLGWQLNIGGAVTREVRGLPDEHPRGYYDSGVQSIMNNYINNNSIGYFDAKKLADGWIDTEIDKYNLSVNGINFSFKIGIDGTPAFFSKHDYKLQIIKNTTNPKIVDRFVLTDTNSNKYYFDQKEINEPYLDFGDFFDKNFTS